MPQGTVKVLPRRFQCADGMWHKDFMFVCSVKLCLDGGAQEKRNVFRDSNNKYHLVKSK